jgi:hypothetical protein
MSLIAGCSGITLEKGVEVSPGDWVMAGGSPEQTNVSSYELAPPLNLYWDYNLEGGVGSAGIPSLTQLYLLMFFRERCSLLMYLQEERSET